MRNAAVALLKEAALTSFYVALGTNLENQFS
jgi:hypothetical protein